MHLVAGTQLKNGQYLLNHVLDQQGIGWTYRATQTQLQQTVLVKTLNPTLRSHPQFGQICQDFCDRSRQLSSLRHPSLVRVLDIFIDQQDMPFVVLEYLQGISLNDWMNDRKRGESEVIQLLRQMSHVLTYLQQHNLPHANLKPRNILYSSDAEQAEKNRLVLVGFAPSLKLSEMIATRNPYSAPELRNGEVTSSSDLYSLAGLLYYCLTQHPPVETSASTDDLQALAKPLVERIVDHRFPLMSLLKPGAQRLLRSGSQPNSSDRPPTAELWLAQLSKSRATQKTAAKPIETQVQVPTETQIQAPIENQIQDQRLAISQRPTYLQDATGLWKTTNRPTTQVQPPTTQVQEPGAAPPQSNHVSQPSQRPPRTLKDAGIAPAENLPRYRTTPVTVPPSEGRILTAPARYIPDESNDPRFADRDSNDRRRSSESRSKYLPTPRAIKITLLLAALAGLTFGVVLRSQRPGSSFFHTGQSFPAREWKGTLTPDPDATKDVFTEPGSQNPEQAPEQSSKSSTRANSSSAESSGPSSEPAKSEPAAQFPVRSKSFDPDDVLIPEAASSSTSPAQTPDPEASVEAPQRPTPEEEKGSAKSKKST
jgi:eukaryotic-like serine/threonine-protein kinase